MLTLTYFIWFLTASFFMFLLETFLPYLITNKRKLSFLFTLFFTQWLAWVTNLLPTDLLEWEFENHMCCLYLIINSIAVFNLILILVDFM